MLFESIFEIIGRAVLRPLKSRYYKWLQSSDSFVFSILPQRGLFTAKQKERTDSSTLESEKNIAQRLLIF